MAENKPEHIDADSIPRSTPAGNPLANTIGVNVSVPEEFNIRMVDATVLGDYEVWLWFSSAMVSLVVGFLVAYCQNTTKTITLVVSIIFFVILVFSLIMAYLKRRKLKRKVRLVKFRASGVE